MDNNKDRPMYLKTEKFMKFFANLCGAAILVNMLLVFCDVIMRYLFVKPILGATEVVALLMAYIAYLGVAYTMVVSGHMQMTAVLDKVTGRAKIIENCIIYLFAIFLFSVLTYASFLNFYNSIIVGEKAVAAVTVYLWIGKLAVPVGCALTLIQSIITFIWYLTKLVKPKSAIY